MLKILIGVQSLDPDYRGKNSACTTGANTALNTRVWPGELCTPGTVAVIFKRDWPVQDFFLPDGRGTAVLRTAGSGSTMHAALDCNT